MYNKQKLTSAPAFFLSLASASSPLLTSSRRLFTVPLWLFFNEDTVVKCKNIKQ